MHDDRYGEQCRIGVILSEDIQVLKAVSVVFQPECGKDFPVCLDLCIPDGNFVLLGKPDGAIVFQVGEQVDVHVVPFRKVGDGVQGYLACRNLACNFVTVVTVGTQQGVLRGKLNLVDGETTRRVGNLSEETLAGLGAGPEIQFVERDGGPLGERSLLGDACHLFVDNGDGVFRFRCPACVLVFG